MQSVRVNSKNLKSDINDMLTGRRLLSHKPPPEPSDGTFLGASHEVLKIQALDAMQFLTSHPAFEDRFPILFWLWPAKVCKRGISAEDGMANVWITAEGAERFLKDFEEEYEQEIPNWEEAVKKFPLWHLRKPYEEVYGEPWVMHQVQYWWEMSFSLYHGSVERESKEWCDEKK
jgi:hypothetical protein